MSWLRKMLLERLVVNVRGDKMTMDQAVKHLAAYDRNLQVLEDILSIQLASGNWNYDNYMHGMANGLLLAQATLRESEYNPLSPPKRWLSDRKNTHVDFV